MKLKSAVLLGLLGTGLALGGASVSPLHAAGVCDTPTLENGSFESFTLGTAPFASSPPDASVIGDWMNDWGPPKQFLFLDLDVAPQSLDGWQTTNSQNYVELQRQVRGWKQDGTRLDPGYFDFYAVQPARGSYWAELNATEDAALYQDVNLTAGTEYTWSIKHHGRVVEVADEMAVFVGLSGGTLDQQTTIRRYEPANPDLFVGEPYYTETYTNVSTIEGTILDGWVMYRGTFTPATSGVYTFEFRGLDGWAPAVGNMLDDIEFVPTECVSLPTAGTPTTTTTVQSTTTTVESTTTVDSLPPTGATSTTFPIGAVTVLAGIGLFAMRRLRFSRSSL